MKREELNELIDEALDGVISEADFLRLEAELHVDEAARKVYYERLKLHTVLEMEAGERKELGEKVARFPLLKNSMARLGAIAAVLLVFAMALGWQLGSGRKGETVVQKEPLATGFGVLAEP